MIGDLWGSFPRLMERNINSLLHEAVPHSVKAYQLYKACQFDELWTGNFENFSKCLDNFFALPKSQRRKSAFDVYLERPMDQSIFGSFHLTFRTGVVKESSLLNLANWAYNLIRVSKKMQSEVISLEVMIETLKSITNPSVQDKEENIEFSDFCAAWKKIVFKNYGKKHENEFQSLLTELTQIDNELKAAEKKSSLQSLPHLGLVRDEIDWIRAVESSVTERKGAPRWKSHDVPPKLRLLELDRIVSLYMIVQKTRLPELIKHRENIRLTILDRCMELLGKK